METADSLIKGGFQDVGYNFVIIDDCWLAKERDGHGRLQPDPNRFPRGMPAIAQYLHERYAMSMPCDHDLQLDVDHTSAIAVLYSVNFSA